MKITTSKSGEKGAPKITIDYPLGDTIQEAVDLYGEDVVRGFWLAGAKIAVQQVVRPMMKAGKTEKEIKEFMANYKLGVKSPRGKSPIEKALALFNSLSPEERAELKKQWGKK